MFKTCLNDECEADKRVNKSISKYYEDIDSEDDFDIESDNFEVEKDISAVESGEVENLILS